MVVAKIIGGLGNQMFQYAAGICAARNWGVDFKVDINAFETYRLHNGFELSKVFAIDSKLASKEEVHRLIHRPSGMLNRLFRRPLEVKENRHYIEPKFSFDRFPDQFKNGLYLDGYWQSEKYFLGEHEYVRSLFRFRHPLSGKNKSLADLAQGVNSISLHVRRGDYVSNKETNSFHGVLGKEYYYKALALMNEKVSNPYFFIFSDDPQWCKESLNLSSQNTVFVEGNIGASAWEDMRLMSLCKHHIIANSSFSWWGAWLNKNENKNVIAPFPWFLSNKLDTRDVLPVGWLKCSPMFQIMSS